MDDAIVGELRVALLVYIDPSQTYFRAGVWIRKAMGSSYDPQRMDEGSATGTVNSCLRVMLVDSSLPWDLTELGEFSLDDGWTGRVVSWWNTFSGRLRRN